jgi:hypothetical protein
MFGMLGMLGRGGRPPGAPGPEVGKGGGKGRPRAPGANGLLARLRAGFVVWLRRGGNVRGGMAGAPPGPGGIANGGGNWPG